MTPPIDQMISYLEGEMAKYAPAFPKSYMDSNYRLLDQARTQAEKIKERCRDEAMQALISRVAVDFDGGIQVVEANDGFTGCKFGTHVANLGANGTYDSDIS